MALDRLSNITRSGLGSVYTYDVGGIISTGVITATSFAGNITGNITGDVTGNLTGDVTGNLTGNISGNTVVSGIITATSFVGDGSGLTGVGIGTDGSVNTSGIITASSFSGDGSELKSVSGTTLATYSSAADIAYSAKSIVGLSGHSQVGVLTAGSTNSDNGDKFGRAVAMSANGKTLFVGAPNDEINGAVNFAGAVYVFERVGAGSSFNQLGILTGSSENGQFGESIACSADGKTVVVTAPWDATDLGLAYVFDRSGDTYTRVGILSNSIPDPNNYSGPYTSADISADGKLIILANEGVQPPGMLDDTGAVFLWKRDGDTFTEVGIVTNTRNTAGSEWSESVAISGDGKTIVVGALSDYTGSDYHGSVSIFDVVGVGTNLSFNNVGILTGFLYSGDPWDAFGCSVDINYDGSSIIVGDFNGEIQGATVSTGTAHVYDRVGNTYSLVQTFTGSQSITNGSFGNTVVMSPDGKQMLVAARNEAPHRVYKFERYGNTINQVGIITAYSLNYPLINNMGAPWDKHLAMSADGKSILVGYESANTGGTVGGAAVVFDQVNDTYLSPSSAGDLLLYSKPSGGSTVERLRIDSDGRVTMPYQPVFQAYGISGGTYASGSYMIFPSVHTNIGSHYNTSNGIFTAPVAGTYYFYWSHIGNNTNDVYRFHIHKNNSTVGDWHLRLDTSATGSEYEYGERSINLTLSANDTIRIYFASDGGTSSYPGGNDANSNYPTFGGYLIG